MASTKKKTATAIAEPVAWERQPGESLAAYARFVLYRNTPAPDRSMRRVGVAKSLAFAWAKQHRWVERVDAYEAWLAELQDGLSVAATLTHRQKVARFANRAIDKATLAVEHANHKKLGTGAALELVTGATALARQALAIPDARSPASTANFAVGVSFGATETPAWLQGASVKTKHNELDNNCIDAVVNKGNDSDVKVLAERVGPNRHVHALPGSPEQTGQTGPPAALTQKIKNKNKNFIKGGEPGNGPE